MLSKNSDCDAIIILYATTIWSSCQETRIMNSRRKLVNETCTKAAAVIIGRPWFNRNRELQRFARTEEFFRLRGVTYQLHVFLDAVPGTVLFFLDVERIIGWRPVATVTLWVIGAIIIVVVRVKEEGLERGRVERHAAAPTSLHGLRSTRRLIIVKSDTLTTIVNGHRRRWRWTTLHNTTWHGPVHCITGINVIAHTVESTSILVRCRIKIWRKVDWLIATLRSNKFAIRSQTLRIGVAVA